MERKKKEKRRKVVFGTITPSLLLDCPSILVKVGTRRGGGTLSFSLFFLKSHCNWIRDSLNGKEEGGRWKEETTTKFPQQPSLFVKALLMGYGQTETPLPLQTTFEDEALTSLPRTNFLSLLLLIVSLPPAKGEGKRENFRYNNCRLFYLRGSEVCKCLPRQKKPQNRLPPPLPFQYIYVPSWYGIRTGVSRKYT